MYNEKNNFFLRKSKKWIQSKIPKLNINLENDLFYFDQNPNQFNRRKSKATDSEGLSLLNTFLLNIAAAIPTAMILQEYLIEQNMLVQFLNCFLIQHLLLFIGNLIILGKQKSKDSLAFAID